VPPAAAMSYTRNLTQEGNADNLIIATNHSPSHILIYKVRLSSPGPPACQSEG
jgi:hypothetical protein